MGTNTGTVMTIANSIIGVSVLAMPFCFKQCGIILSIVMLILSSMLTRLTCYLLLKSAMMSRRRTFEYLAFHIFGPTGKFLTELCIIGYLMGTCIAFFVIVGDLGPEIISESLQITNSPALRPSFMIGLAILVILPLGLLRNVDSLSSVCIASIGFYFCLVLKVFFEALPHLVSGIWLENVYYWRPAGVLQCLPIFSGALFCQMTLFEIYESLPNPSLERMNAAVHTAINMCTAFYISVGFLGYVAFCTEPFGGNILLSFLPSVMSDLFKFGFVLSLAVSFPLVIFPCRVSLNSLIYRRVQGPQHESSPAFIPELRFKCLTSVIIALSLAVGLIIPNIELVLGLVGSTIGVAICVMFPALAFLFVSAKRTADRATAQFLLGAGIVILVLGTYATLSARPDTKSEVNTHEFVQPQVAERLEAVAVKVEEPLVVVARREPPVPQESVPVDKDKSEVIHKDALKKEDEELALAEKVDEGERQRENVELLRKIEKNKEEQEKLLQEQKALILGLQKDSARKAESKKKEVDKDGEKPLKKIEKVLELEVKEPEVVGSEGKEVEVTKPVVVPQVEMKLPEDGVIVKPASQNAVKLDDSKPPVESKQAEIKIPPQPKVFAKPDKDSIKSDKGPVKPGDPVKVVAPPVESKSLRNMTIKSIVMPDFANKLPLKKPVVPETKQVRQPNELDSNPQVDKILSVDILKDAAARLDDGKLNQRDILSAPGREKRDIEGEDCVKEEKDIVAIKPVVAMDKPVVVGNASDSLIKVSARLSAPQLVADGVVLPSLGEGLKDLVDESKPLSRDLKSLGSQGEGKNVTATTGDKLEV